MKKILIVFLILLVFSLYGCMAETSIYIVEKADYNNKEDFYKLGLKEEVNIFFFDIDSISNNLVEPVKTYNSIATQNIGSSESYLIKIGDIEILVDAGYRNTNSSQEIINNVNNNLLKKIASLCSDGILEYLIITHADFDHIASLVTEKCIIDAFLEQKTIMNMNDEAVKFKSIKNIIDFNSGVVALHSYTKIDSEKRLYKTLTYQNYIKKIGVLINSGTNYLPAASLFSSAVETSNGKTMSLENKLISTPNNMLKHVKDYFEQRILTENLGNDAASQYVNEIKKNCDYIENVNALCGELKEQNDRFYYSINLSEKTELRFLYNWYYDFMYREGFDDQSRNNPSVCIELVSGNFKFLTLGDLGGNGENGLINYYTGTDILNNVTVYKASHHGSTKNGENSATLFNIMKPQVIVLTCCAQSKLETINNNTGYVSQSFFDNLYEGIKSSNNVNPYVLCTNINWFSLDESNYNQKHDTLAFYGDIHLYGENNILYLDYSYIGNIHAFLGKNEGVIDFKTIQKGKVLRMQETEWFSKTGLYFGEKTNEKGEDE